MRNQLRCIALIGMLLSLLGCSNAAPELPGDIEIVDIIDTEPNIINIHTPTPRDAETTPLPTPIQKFYDDWSTRYDSNLSPSQHAYCLSHSNKKSFTEIKDWIFLVNEEPSIVNGKTYGVLETKCSAIITLFNNDLMAEKLNKGSAIIASGEFSDNILELTKYLKID